MLEVETCDVELDDDACAVEPLVVVPSEVSDIRDEADPEDDDIVSNAEVVASVVSAVVDVELAATFTPTPALEVASAFEVVSALELELEAPGLSFPVESPPEEPQATPSDMSVNTESGERACRNMARSSLGRGGRERPIGDARPLE